MPVAAWQPNAGCPGRMERFDPKNLPHRLASIPGPQEAMLAAGESAVIVLIIPAAVVVAAVPLAVATIAIPLLVAARLGRGGGCGVGFGGGGGGDAFEGGAHQRVVHHAVHAD